MSYTLHGDYYLPDLVLNEAEPTYGMLRKQFLKEHWKMQKRNLELRQDESAIHGIGI